jgi:hypothetical protein
VGWDTGGLPNERPKRGMSLNETPRETGMLWTVEGGCDRRVGLVEDDGANRNTSQLARIRIWLTVGNSRMVPVSKVEA